MILILIMSLVSSTIEKHDLKTKWKVFCEKHLIADDPYDDPPPPPDENGDDDGP